MQNIETKEGCMQYLHCKLQRYKALHHKMWTTGFMLRIIVCHFYEPMGVSEAYLHMDFCYCRSACGIST